MRADRWLALALAVTACGGEVADEVIEQPFRPARARAAAAAADSGETGLLSREVFSYVGGSRDPFESQVGSAAMGPEFADLMLVAVYVDHANPDRSVAVFRELVGNKPHNLQVGDRLGRMRVTAIREREVDVLIDDFGTERRERAVLRKPSEDN